MNKKLTDYKWIVLANGAEYYHIPAPVAQQHDRESAAKDAVIEVARAMIEAVDAVVGDTVSYDQLASRFGALGNLRAALEKLEDASHET